MDFILKGIQNLLGNLFGGLDGLFGRLGQPAGKKRGFGGGFRAPARKATGGSPAKPKALVNPFVGGGCSGGT